VSGAKPSHPRQISTPEESSKFNRKIFQSYWLQNDKNCVPDNVVTFRMQNRVIRARFSTFPAPVETWPRKFIKIRSNYLSTLLIENDRNCTINCMGTLVVPNVLIWARFSTLAVPVMIGPRKVIKIRPKHFFAILMGNDNNCSPKSVGMFRALNRVIWVPISTFHTPVVLGPETIVKICPRLFLPGRIKKGKKCAQIVWVYFNCQIGVIQARFSTLTAPVVLGPEKVVKIRPEHFSSVLIGKS